ncbi:MAG: molybdate ABC transporter substrate-binding protein [Chloroflexi bacterium]|nr:molybdate ABC transporter substrate-binding protein [Chloroflexota bacterium]
MPLLKRPHLRLLACCLLFAAVAAFCASSGGGKGITVAAASDLTFAFQELGKRFEEKTGTKVTFTFGSTGQLAQQVEHGAPVDLFAAADQRAIDDLTGKGRLVPGTKALYARGFLAIWTRKASDLRLERLEDLAQPGVQRIAIANPEHAPYGIAAREAMETSGLWESLRPKLVYGENIRQALQFAETGNVDAAIVALSLAQRSDGRWVRVPDGLHKPLEQALAVVSGSKREQAARAFASFVTSEEGRAILRSHGFSVPGEPR